MSILLNGTNSGSHDLDGSYQWGIAFNDNGFLWRSGNPTNSASAGWSVSYSSPNLTVGVPALTPSTAVFIAIWQLTGGGSWISGISAPPYIPSVSLGGCTQSGNVLTFSMSGSAAQFPSDAAVGPLTFPAYAWWFGPLTDFLSDAVTVGSATSLSYSITVPSVLSQTTFTYQFQLTAQDNYGRNTNYSEFGSQPLVYPDYTLPSGANAIISVSIQANPPQSKPVINVAQGNLVSFNGTASVPTTYIITAGPPASPQTFTFTNTMQYQWTVINQSTYSSISPYYNNFRGTFDAGATYQYLDTVIYDGVFSVNNNPSFLPPAWTPIVGVLAPTVGPTVATSTSASFSAELPPGSYQATLKVYDGYGNYNIEAYPFVVDYPMGETCFDIGGSVFGAVNATYLTYGTPPVTVQYPTQTQIYRYKDGTTSQEKLTLLDGVNPSLFQQKGGVRLFCLTQGNEQDAIPYEAWSTKIYGGPIPEPTIYYSDDWGQTFQTLNPYGGPHVATPWTTAYQYATLTGTLDGGFASVAIQFTGGAFPYSIYFNYSGDGTWSGTPVLVGTSSSPNLVYSCQQCSESNSAQFIVSNGIDTQFISQDYGNTWSAF